MAREMAKLSRCVTCSRLFNWGAGMKTRVGGMQNVFPAFPRRGGCADQVPLKTGADGAVVPKRSIVQQPPRPLLQRMLRGFLLMSRPPRLAALHKKSRAVIDRPYSVCC